MHILTEYVEFCFGTSQRYSRRHIRRDASQGTVVMVTIDPENPQVAVLLKPSTGVRQLSSVQRPVEVDHLSV